MKKVYTATFKAQLVLELLKETKTIGELAAEYQVHPNVLRAWRDQAVKVLPTVFEKRDSLIDAQATHAKQLEELYAEIGRLTTHVTFLKKRLPS
jgi:transposase-like protein